MVDQLNQLIRAIIMEPDMRERFAQEGAVPTPVSSSEFAAVVRADLDKWRRSPGSGISSATRASP